MRPHLLSAAAYPLRGLAFLARHRELWKYAAAAFALNVLLLTALVALLFLYRDDLAALLAPSWAPAWLRSGLGCLLAFAGLVALLLAFTVVGNLLAAPFLDAMTERILLLKGEPAPPPRGLLGTLGRALLNQTLKLLFLGAFQGALLLLLLTPAAPLYPLLSAGSAVLFVAFEYLDYPLDARRLGVSDRFGYLLAHPGPALGFGAACSALLFVPLLGYFALPAAVCGAALLAHDIDGPPRPPGV